ncbi:serine/threonine-protein kinase [Streptomyces sp. DSM 41527]|uniref:Serine/threonine-protein kinase n=1 Tax=Streptomyces mooreae TaxID=3075523 RepID=A0ABU2TJR8_9ACTN|nr:serine/threonine-protein kinase [Streptomyces sp. DSM 41527]MDT0461196.1 serine/threonine-protein kinase [Streptomyces sp. DSM 41527]
MDGLRGLTADDPQWIGDYRLLSRLGSGGMGRVYLARSEGGRTVAVKLVKAELAVEEEFRDRFRAEVAAARRVGGRWTAPVLDADTEAAVPWVATGYIAGPTLSEVVGGSYGRPGSYGPLPEHSLRQLAYGLACALRDIHGGGLVHRDLKPSNVLLTIDGPRVIDFGIARALDGVGDRTRTRTGTVLGSPSFMSPEQVRGQRAGPASDVFCVGSVLAYAATGRQPFGSLSSGVHAVMFKIAQEDPELAGTPDGIRGLLLDCLTKDPAARPTPEEIADRTGPEPGGASAAPWLPAELIARLGAHAVRLLDTDTPPGGQPPTLTSTRSSPAPAPPPPDETSAPAPLDATSAPAPRRRPHWLPLLVTAVAVAAATAVAVPLLSAGADAGESPSDIPARFLGTWSGPVLRDGVPTGGQRRFVISNGKVGEVVANSTSLGTTYECRSDAKLVSVTTHDGHPALRLDTTVVRSVPEGRCTALGEHTLEAGDGGTLAWAAEGRTATLHRTGPADTSVPAGYLGTWQRPTDDGHGTQRLTLAQAPAGSTVLTTAVVGRGGRCTAHADLYSAQGGKLTVGPSVVDRPAPGCAPGSSSVLRLNGDGTLHREFLDDDKQPRTYCMRIDSS